MNTHSESLPSAPHVAVSCEGLTKVFGKGDAMVKALRGVDMNVQNGELLMLVGPSGCGKTTLISIIAGVLRRDAGQCTIFGQDYNGMSEEEAEGFLTGDPMLMRSSCIGYCQYHPIDQI